MTASALRRYTLKLYPNAAQARAMEARRLAHQELYNAALQQRIEAWQRQRRHITLYDQQKEVPALRREIEALAPIGVTELRGTLARVDRAMRAFMQRARQGAGRSSGFPRFQPAYRYPGWSYEDKGGWSWTWREGKRADLRIMGLGTIKARGNPPYRGEVRACTVMYRDGAWWASIVMDCPARRCAGDRALTVRLDLVTSFATVAEAASAQGAVHAPAFGPNLPVFAGEPVFASKGSAEPDAVPPQKREGCNDDRDLFIAATDAVPPQKREGCNERLGSDGRAGDAVPPQKREGCNLARRRACSRGDAVPPQKREGCNRSRRGCCHGTDAVPPQKREGCNCADPAVAELQRAMARCKRGSHRYRELRRRKRRLQAIDARRRAWALHNWTTAIVSTARHLTIIAPPSIRDATASARGSAKRPGAAIAFKAAFNRTLLSFAPAEAIAQLMYKADEAGVHLETIDDANGPARIGNDLVRAAKAARSLARKARRQQKETTP